MKKIKFLHLPIYAIFVLFISIPSPADENTKNPLTHNDYDTWKSIRSKAISSGANWVLYLEVPQDGNGRIVVVNPAAAIEYSHTIGYTGEDTDSEKAADPQFSYDEKYVVFLISPSQEKVNAIEETEGDKKNKDKEKEKNKNLGIMDLSTGKVTIIDSVKSFTMPEEAGGWLAYLKEKPESGDKETKDKEEKEKKKSEKEKVEETEKKETGKSEKSEEEKKKEKKDKKRKEREEKRKEGTKLIVREFSQKQEIVLSYVTNYRFTKDGKHLYYIVLTKDSAAVDGIFRLTSGESEGKALLTGKGDFKHLSLNEEETRLAFLTNRDDYEADEPVFSLYGCEIGSYKAELWVSHKSFKGFPQGMSVSDKSKILFSEDGSIVMFGIKEIPELEDEDEKDEEKAVFDLWHWQDPYPQPQQKKMSEDVKNNTWESVYHIDKKKFVRLADEDLPDVKLNRKGIIAFGQTNWPYARKTGYFGTFNDVYVVNTMTGKKKLVKKHLLGYRGGHLSPDGNYVAWFENGCWYVYNVTKERAVNITKGLNVSFSREDHDRPEPASSYGTAGWTKKDESIVIYDRYDIWQISPDGKKRKMITEGFGRKHNLSFRYIQLDPDEKAVDPDESMLLRTVNEKTMASGFYRDRVNGRKIPEKLLFADKQFGYPEKAKKSRKLLFTREAFDEYPDLWVSGPDLKNPQKITSLGSQMDPFIWGKTELIDFASSDGKPLKGILIKPDNFNPHKKYPLMVYIYETLHSRLHSYRNPSPGSSINPSFYASNGYIIWMPDIEYDTGYPGQDALKCVLPGIQLLISKGFIDEDAIGIQGHSWGGYQIAYMITQTNIFAAVEAGAPVSNMTSSYGGIRWGSGMVRQFQYEKTQSRLGASLWEVPMRYIENSPLFYTDRVETPIMMMHNDEDGAVPWYQGIEYIMALRRLNKEAYMFNYNHEKHGLRKRINQKDWTVRLSEFFNHHLKGTPIPDWMKNGIKAWEKE